MASIEPCPCENEAPHPAPGKIEDNEEIIRLVSRQDHLIANEAGLLKLVATHWSRSDLRGEKRKNASVLRASTPIDDLDRRATAFNKEDGWVDDPMIATATVRPLRGIIDEKNHREVCINADPIVDQHGPCPTHGGIVRSEPGVGPKDQRTAILTLALALCEHFEVNRLSDYKASRSLTGSSIKTVSSGQDDKITTAQGQDGSESKLSG